VNNRDTNRTQNFTYDTLNRIATAYTSGTNWGETFTTDAWGGLDSHTLPQFVFWDNLIKTKQNVEGWSLRGLVRE